MSVLFKIYCISMYEPGDSISNSENTYIYWFFDAISNIMVELGAGNRRHALLASKDST